MVMVVLELLISVIFLVLLLLEHHCANLDEIDVGRVDYFVVKP